MSGADAAALLAVVLLVGATAGAAAAETVLLRLSLVRALRLDEQEFPGAPRLLWLMQHRSRALNVVLLLTVTLRTVTAAVVVALVVRHLPGAPGVTLAAGGLAVVSFVAAEVAPRTVTLRHLEAAGLRLAPLMVGLTRALDPLARALVSAGRTLVRTRSAVSGPYPSEEELSELLAETDEDEEIEEDERAMIHSIFELGDTIVREIMVPRPDMVTIAEDAGLQALVALIIEHGYSRIPVHRGARDHIVGVVYAKDVLRRLALEPDAARWLDLVRPPTFVPETKRVGALLRELQEQAVHQALVVDEYGALTGLVTIEDILEEIVGEIIDEHDTEEPLVELLEGGDVRVDARLSVDDLNELLGARLPDDGWDTVGGLVFGVLGHVPSPGESVEIEGLTLTAEEVQGRRVSKVVVTPGADREETAGVEG